MPELPSSPVRRALASALRRRREHAGMSGDEVAAELGWSASKVSRIETHRTGIKPRDLEAHLNLYGVDDAQRHQLRALADEQNARGWWAAYAGTLDADYVSYMSLEDSAESFCTWSPEIIHGLLQTEDYARAATTIAFGSPAAVPPGQIQRLIDSRLRRQQMLSAPGSRHFTFILDEATLRHRFGEAKVMRDQLLRVEELSHLPQVSVRVLAFAGRYPISPGGFTLLEFSSVHGTSIGDIVYMEHLNGNFFVMEEENDTYRYRLAFDRLMDEALDDDASRELIMQVGRDVWAG